MPPVSLLVLDMLISTAGVPSEFETSLYVNTEPSAIFTRNPFPEGRGVSRPP